MTLEYMPYLRRICAVERRRKLDEGGGGRRRRGFTHYLTTHNVTHALSHTLHTSTLSTRR